MSKRAPNLGHLELVKIVYQDGGHALVKADHAWEYQADPDYAHTEFPTDAEILQWISHFDAPRPMEAS